MTIPVPFSFLRFLITESLAWYDVNLTMTHRGLPFPGVGPSLCDRSISLRAMLTSSFVLARFTIKSVVSSLVWEVSPKKS